MRIVVALLIILISFSSPLWARGAYKWMGEDGIMHYSDRLQGDNASIIIIPIKESVLFDDASAEAKNDGRQSEENPVTDKQRVIAEKKVRKENCAKAREQLERNENLGRMYRVAENGEREYLSEAEQAAVLKDSLKAVEYWCD